MDGNFAKSSFFNDEISTKQRNSDTSKGNLIKQTYVWICLKNFLYIINFFLVTIALNEHNSHQSTANYTGSDDQPLKFDNSPGPSKQSIKKKLNFTSEKKET